MRRVAIIGAGVAGLAAAADLQAAGFAVTLYEKSRGVGGRMATRREGDWRFDHGAQYVKAPAGRLRTMLETVYDENQQPVADIGRPVWVFDGGGRISAGDVQQNSDPKWFWPAGLNSLARTMARDLTIRRETEVARIVAQTAGYRLLDRAGQSLGEAELLLLTAPAPQTAAILEGSIIDAGLRDRMLAALQAVSYRRCLAITLAYPRRPALAWYALVNSDRAHPVSWLACEHDKHGHAPAGAGLIILQMSHQWSLDHYEQLARGLYGAGGAQLPPILAEARRLGEQLLGADPGRPYWAYVQRWRYALPDGAADHATLQSGEGGLYFAGDYMAGQGRVHLAIESGWRAAAAIIAREAV